MLMLKTLGTAANSWLIKGLARLGSGRRIVGTSLETEMPRFPAGASLGGVAVRSPHQEKPFRLEAIGQVPVDYDLPWENALLLGGPNTGVTGIRRVGDQYAKRSGVVSANITLVNFKEAPTFALAQGFGEERGLGRPLDPRACFALSQHRPRLNQGLNLKEMQVVSLEKCEIGGIEHLPCLRWYGNYRSVYALPLQAKLGEDCWFGFIKE